MDNNATGERSAGAAGAERIGVRPPAYRLPEATVLGRARLEVADLARSLDYYVGILGVRVLAQTKTSATLGPHGNDTPLVELHEVPGARPVPRRGRLGLYHFAILLPDRRSLGQFIAHLAARGERAGMSDHFVSEAVYLTDPDGLGIEVYADRPRQGWRSEGGQLYMTTAPLDARALVQLAGDARWAGMPPGTRIGHIHLHVNDLATASAFYHDALGFDKVVWSYPGALFLSAGGYHHHLGTNTWAAGADQARQGDARLLDWELILPGQGDADAAARSLAGAGYATLPLAGGWSAADPVGTTLRILSASSAGTAG